MRAREKLGVKIAVLALLVVVVLLSFSFRPPVDTANAVTITFVGYTNLPGNPLKFALLSVSNQASYSLRWRGSWVEVEGNADHKAETLNPQLPGFSRETVLKARRSMLVAIGDPLYDSADGHWRYARSFVPYTWQERWLDYSRNHQAAQKLNSLLSFAPHRLFSPSNATTTATSWLSK